MKTILYLINLSTSSVINRFEGEDDDIPQEVQDAAQRATDDTGDTHVIARGKLFFQAGPGY